MRSIKFNLSKKSANGWDAAVLLTEGYFSARVKADELLEQLPDEFIGQVRARCQSLFLGALRHGHRTKKACHPLMRKTPRPRVEAVLLVAGFEFVAEPEERHPKIVHHAVERSKALLQTHELPFLNAVLRKLPGALAEIQESGDLAARYSHPDWLVTHWLETFGHGATSALLDWNQQIPPLYLKLVDWTDPLPEVLQPSDWQGFYRIDTKADWRNTIQALLETGRAYIKDPSTRLAPELLAPKPGQSVLDLCAAPGGKAFEMAQKMAGRGRIVAVDLPGARIHRLRENLDRLATDSLETHILEQDLTTLSADSFKPHQLPVHYDAVMLDAPCSNTGVIQRRADVKWRLRPEDIKQCAKLQQQLLHSAARFVRPGGRLAYSTCSIEPAENRQLVDAFLASKSGQAFKQISETLALPWECGHDGASVFLLERLA